MYNTQRKKTKHNLSNNLQQLTFSYNLRRATLIMITTNKIGVTRNNMSNVVVVICRMSQNVFYNTDCDWIFELLFETMSYGFFDALNLRMCNMFRKSFMKILLMTVTTEAHCPSFCLHRHYNSTIVLQHRVSLRAVELALLHIRAPVHLQKNDRWRRMDGHSSPSVSIW